jgi:hypothetical protein
LTGGEEDSELWFGSASESILGMSLGETVLRNVHPRRVCHPQNCVLHNPSDHHMRTWPTHWRGDRRLMERLCQHGVGHPDPDDVAWHVSQDRHYQDVHGCDGCCRRPVPTEG